MSRIQRSYISRIAILASGAMLLFGGSALAQTVSVFDDAPSIEQLRSIMIPQSHPGLSRSIVIQHPELPASPDPVQRASTQPQAAPRAPAAAKSVPQPAMQTAAAVPMPKSDPAPESADTSGAVAFHVNFAFNSATLPASAQQMINLVAHLMKESPEIKVRVEGHTDAKGSPTYNLSLSERRALSVGEYLVRQGVDPARLVVIGKGMSEPLTPNKYDPANRRVQFVRIA